MKYILFLIIFLIGCNGKWQSAKTTPASISHADAGKESNDWGDNFDDDEDD
jgi:hypothetical protein